MRPPLPRQGVRFLRRGVFRCLPFGAGRLHVSCIQSVNLAHIFQEGPIILGSQSADRRQIMDELATEHGSFAFRTCSAVIDEKAVRAEDPAELVCLLAAAKASAILKASTETATFTTGYLVTCDQVVFHQGQVLERPESVQQARAFLRSYSASSATIFGAVMVTHLASRSSCCEAAVVPIHFRTIPDTTIEQLLAEGDVLGAAGALMVEHPLVVPLVVETDWARDAVMGLSKVLLVKLLLQAARMGACK